jgi:LacI family transcriptional regulator
MASKSARRSRAKAPVRSSSTAVRAGAEATRAGSATHKHTINDIARLANVSKKTVSRVLNQSPFVREETRSRVSEIMQKVAYTPDPQARGLAFRRSFLIGLVYDNPNAQYIVNIQEGVLGAIRRSGFELVVHPCDRNSATFLPEVKSFIGRQKLDGVILLPPISEDPALARMLQEMNCRYIRVLAVPLDDPSNIVLAMDRDAARQVAEHLARLGHSRIALIAGPSSYRSAHERLSGFSDALADHGLALPQEYVVEGAYTFESGFAAAATLLSRFPRPTAIFACNDEMAAGVYKAAYLKGLQIPKDLTVVGYDDAPLASRIWPSLTTVRLPIRDMGKIAAERLIAKIQQPEGPATPASTVHPHLVVRDSSSKPSP